MTTVTLSTSAINCAHSVLRAPPPVAPVQGYTLAAMQDATLALYAEVAGAVRG